jgi:hypothetical protein
MKITRRRALVSLAAVPVSLTAAQPQVSDGAAARLLGSWHVTSAVTSIILSIEPAGEGLFIFLENGAYNIARVLWRPLPGGLLVEGALRIRVWLGRNPEELRAEMEELPPQVDVSDGFARFPLAFFMRRVSHRQVSREMLERELPKQWLEPTVPEGWDEKAGKRRELRKRD